MKPIPEWVKTPTDLLVYLGNIIEEMQAEIEVLKQRPAINKADGLVCAKCYERIGE